MPRSSLAPLLAVLGIAAARPAASPVQASDRIRLRIDTAQATAVLAILEADPAHRPVPEGAWRRLFASEGYVRLKAREAAMRRSFEDRDFAEFVRSDTLGARTAALRGALDAWARADLRAGAERVLQYLPEEARIDATVYIVIKPRTNSFVWEVSTNPAIFLYLDPAVTAGRFANTVAHELHHIGFASVKRDAEATIASLPDSVRPALEWMGAFGEGFAMLAAAGGPDAHPHADSPPEDRARWDADAAHFNHDVRTLERFFLDIVSRRLADSDSIRAVAFTFYGTQGPWYTVGWRMAVTIERRFGREELIRCMTDPRLLLERYNAAARDHNREAGDTLATWSPELLAAMQATAAPE